MWNYSQMQPAHTIFGRLDTKVITVYQLTIAEVCGLEPLHGSVLREPTAFAWSKFDTSRALLHSGMAPHAPGIRSWQLGRRLCSSQHRLPWSSPPSPSETDCQARAADKNLSSAVGESSSAKMENNRRWHCHMSWSGVFFPLKSYVI